MYYYDSNNSHVHNIIQYFIFYNVFDDLTQSYTSSASSIPIIPISVILPSN